MRLHATEDGARVRSLPSGSSRLSKSDEHGLSEASIRTALQAFRRGLGEIGIRASDEFLASLRKLDPLWESLRPGVGGDLDPVRIGLDRSGRLVSSGCCEQILQSPSFQGWCQTMGINGCRHRKGWEWAFVCQALAERGMLRPGRTGAGFAVGQEPLVSLFASRGCRILATDVAPQQAAADGWVQTGQHADSISGLNKHGFLPDQEFRERVSFRAVDMRFLPPDLGAFDFHWSACAFEHLGSLQAGKEFVWNSYDRLAPGGVAVHTTEYNMDSDWATYGIGNAVMFRRADLEEIAEGIRERGGTVVLDFREGDLPDDQFVDPPPYGNNKDGVHMRLDLFGYRCTSYGLILEKP